MVHDSCLFRPSLHRVCPASKVEIEDAAIYFGHPNIRHFLVVAFKRTLFSNLFVFVWFLLHNTLFFCLAD
jgi:hypothetical protein